MLRNVAGGDRADRRGLSLESRQSSRGVDPADVAAQGRAAYLHLTVNRTPWQITAIKVPPDSAAVCFQ